MGLSEGWAVGSIIEVDQCKAWCAMQHFNNNFEGLQIIYLALTALLLYFIFRNCWLNNWWDVQKLVNEEKATTITNYLILFALLCLLGFVVYVTFFFKPAYASELLYNWSEQNASGMVDQTIIWTKG